MGSLPLMPPGENLKKMYTGSSNHDEGRVRCKLSMFTFSTESKFPKNPPWPLQVPLSLGNVRLPSSPSVHILRFSAFLPICCIDPIFLEGDTLKDDPVSFLIYLLWSSVTSHIWLFATPWTTACQASLSLTISQSLVKLVSIEYVMPSNHLICCFLLLLLPSIFPSIRVFSYESAVCIRWPKYWSFSFSISPSNKYPGLISLRLTGLITLLSKGLSRVFSSTTVWKHQFFITLLSLWSNSHICMWLLERSEPWLYRPLSEKWGRSLLFNTLFRFVITFLLRSNRLLISWLQSPSAVIFRTQEEEICHCLLLLNPPSTCHEVMGPYAMNLVFLILSFKLTFSLASFTLIKRLFSPSSHSAVRVVSSSYLRWFIFLPVT